MKPLPAPARLTPSAAAVFLDLDGTLAPIAATPEAVGPDRRRSQLLRDLGEALQGRLAVVSGRSVAEVDRILEGSVGFVAGVHGLELRRAEEGLEVAEPHPRLGEAVAALEAFAAADTGLRVEDKRLSVTLHYRLAPAMEAEALALARDLADRTGLTLQLGDKVAELRTPGRDKGGAMRELMARPPFHGAAPVFVGDDLTDEDGFRTAAELGGAGVLVGRLRPTAALARLDDVDAVLAWLQASVAAEVRR